MATDCLDVEEILVKAPKKTKIVKPLSELVKGGK